ncbi:uncharacterized protein [Asterias amurensis]|uniref:uncharacterized protein n=1 Tax=Asterias amurensis TaxID=7602 RepID=UPI003AB17EC6
MSRVEWDATESRFKAAMEKMELVIGEYASFQKALDEEENFLAKRRKRLRHARAFFASISQAVSETRKDLENLRKMNQDDEANAIVLERRLSQQFGPMRGSW